MEGPAGGRGQPRGLREGLHQGRGHLLRRPRLARLGGRGSREGQGAARGQGLRHAGRRRRGVPLQQLTLPSYAARWMLHGVVVRSEEHTSELQSLMRISYAVFCLKKQKNNRQKTLAE